MAIQAPTIPARFKNLQAFRTWLKFISDKPDQCLNVLDTLATDLQHAQSGATPIFDLFEAARGVMLTAVEGLLQKISAAVFPLPAADWRCLQQILVSLRRARELFERLYAEQSDTIGIRARTLMPGSVQTLEPLMPLARALDMQVRVLRLQQLHRIDIALADWLALIRVSKPLRTGTLQDAPVPDEFALGKDMTPRALFAYPLLLEAALLPAREPAEVDQIDRLARSWAGKVGCRIDEDGRLHENRHGPTIALSADCSIRLDAHRLTRRLDERIELIEAAKSAADLKLPRGLSRERSLRLLTELHQCWSPSFRPLRWPAATSPTPTRVMLRFGLPAAKNSQQFDGDQMPFGAQSGTADPLPAGMASSSYSYGRLEQDTILRRGRGLDEVGQNAVNEFMSEGEPATLVGRHADLMVVDRQDWSPLRAGGLIAIAPVNARSDKLQLGWVSRQLQGGTGLDGVRTQRIGVSLWPDAGRLAGVRFMENAFFEDVFLLPASAAGAQGNAYPSSVILTPGRWRPGAKALLRLAKQDVRIVLHALIQRGAGFERIEIKLETADNPAT